jgi:hypothetical protein
MELKRALLLLALPLGASACGESTAPPPPTPPASPTALRVDLQTPNPDDGAIVITLRGPGMSDIGAASSGYLTYTRATAGEETRVIVVGDLKAGALVTLAIAPGHQLSDYTALIQQVAARSDLLRADLSGYEVSVSAR